MKLSCEVIQDLLPLYVDNACSEESTGLVEEHMAECENCRQTYNDMKTEGKTEELAKSEEFRARQTDSVKKVKKKWSRSKKICLALGIIIGAGLLYILIRVAMIFGIMGLVVFDSATTKVQVYDDAAKYSEYIGEDCNMEYGKPRTGQFVVFPAEISPQMYVRDFRYVYYNPWDPQYVTYLTVEYKDAGAYGKELKRLQTIGVEEYLLPGFDATLDNPYEQKMMGK